MWICLYQKLLELEDVSEDERKELLSKIDSLESIVRMLELKTKNSHDHGTNDVSSLPVHSSSLYSRVEDFVFLRFMLFIFILVYHSLVVSEEYRMQVYYAFFIIFCSLIIFSVILIFRIWFYLRCCYKNLSSDKYHFIIDMCNHVFFLDCSNVCYLNHYTDYLLVLNISYGYYTNMWSIFHNV